jgi:hypothetical protein
MTVRGSVRRGLCRCAAISVRPSQAGSACCVFVDRDVVRTELKLRPYLGARASRGCEVVVAHPCLRFARAGLARAVEDGGVANCVGVLAEGVRLPRRLRPPRNDVETF